MACANVTGVNFVVIEILRRQHAIVIADQTVFGHHTGVEFNLDFDIARDCIKASSNFATQHAPRFVKRINIGIFAIANIRKLFGHRIVVIARAKAKRGKTDAAFPLTGDKFFELVLIELPDVKIPVAG